MQAVRSGENLGGCPASPLPVAGVTLVTRNTERFTVDNESQQLIDDLVKVGILETHQVNGGETGYSVTEKGRKTWCLLDEIRELEQERILNRVAEALFGGLN